VRIRENTQKIVSDLIDGEMMLLNMEAGHYYSLTGTGAALWESIRQGAERAGLLSALQKAFPAQDSQQITEDLDSFLKELVEEELVVECTECANGKPPFEGEYAPPQLAKYSDLQDLLLLDPIHDADESGWPAAAS